MGGASGRRSHLADVVVDGVRVHLAGGLAPVGVDLAHWHADAVGDVVRRLCPVGRDGLGGKEKKATGLASGR